jgi:hypothetical protein
VYENITEVDTDTKQHAALAGSGIIPFHEGLLDSHGTEDSIRNAVEYSEDAVSGGIHDASIARIAQPPEHTLAFRQGGYSPWLVVAHQPAVASHIGAQDGCEPAGGLGHASRSSTKMGRGREAGLGPEDDSPFAYRPVGTPPEAGPSDDRDASPGTTGRSRAGVLCSVGSTCSVGVLARRLREC